MPLKCLVVGDTTLKGQEISRFLDSNKIQIFGWDGSSLNLNSIASSVALDLVIIAIESYDRAILITEEISRLLPNTISIFLLDSSKNFPWMFMTTMKAMVDRVVFDENIEDLLIIIDEIYYSKYHIIRKIDCEAVFTEREMKTIQAIQMNLGVEEICQRLNISRKTLTRHIADCGEKLGCSGRGAIGVKSFQVFGDLSELLN